MILVTGAAGGCGRLVVEALSGSGHAVRALVRDPRRVAMFERVPGVQVVLGDMADAASLRPAFAGAGTALVCSTANEAMATTQMAFVDAARAAGVSRIVKISGQESGIGFDARAFRFTRMHEEVERYIEDSGIGFVHLRPSQFMQVYLREIPALVRDGTLALPAGEIELAPVDVADVAAIASAALVDESVVAASWPITGPEALTMNSIAAALADAIGAPVRYQAISVEERSRWLAAAGVPESFIAAMEEQALERLRHPRSQIALEAHMRYGLPPTRFAEFARRCIEPLSAGG